MDSLIIEILNFLVKLLLFVASQSDSDTQSTSGQSLVLVHVLFRHGNRTAELSELYPKDPYLNYTYYPIGRGQLTNAGKIKEYTIGKALRERYEGFLGPYYYPDEVEAISTNYNRTKASLELVLASLFQPRDGQTWKKELNWQPVPYNYVPTNKDKVLIGSFCPNYIKLYQEYIGSPNAQAKFKKNKDTFDYISKHTGLNVTTFSSVYDLFFGLATEEEYGLTQPPWTKKVWPDTITRLAIQQYDILSGTRDLRAIFSGYLVRKMLDDTKAKIQNIKQKYGKKIYLYSAHESNIALMLIFLRVFDQPHIPTYGSYLTFEVHNFNNTYGFKIYYQNYETKNGRLLKLPDCDEFCPLEKFIKLYQKYLPTDELCEKS